MPGGNVRPLDASRAIERVRPLSAQAQTRPAELSGSVVRVPTSFAKRNPLSDPARAGGQTMEACDDLAFADEDVDGEGWRAGVADARRQVRACARTRSSPAVR